MRNIQKYKIDWNNDWRLTVDIFTDSKIPQITIPENFNDLSNISRFSISIPIWTKTYIVSKYINSGPAFILIQTEIQIYPLSSKCHVFWTSLLTRRARTLSQPLLSNELEVAVEILTFIFTFTMTKSIHSECSSFNILPRNEIPWRIPFNILSRNSSNGNSKILVNSQFQCKLHMPWLPRSNKRSEAVKT